MPMDDSLAPAPPWWRRWVGSPITFGVAAFVVITIGSQLVAYAVRLTLLEANDAPTMRMRMMGMQLTMILLSVVFARSQPLRPAELFRLKAPRPLHVAAAMLGVLGVLGAGTGYQILQEAVLVPSTWLPEYVAMRNQTDAVYRFLMHWESPLEFVGIAVQIAVVPAICEELFMRGLVQRSFERSLRPWGAIALASLLFGLMHFQWHNLVVLAGSGVFLGYVAVRSGSIAPSMAAHALFNTISLVLLPMMPGFAKRTFTVADLVGFLPYAFAGIVFLLIAIALLRRPAGSIVQPFRS